MAELKFPLRGAYTTALLLNLAVNQNLPQEGFKTLHSRVPWQVDRQRSFGAKAEESVYLRSFGMVFMVCG